MVCGAGFAQAQQRVAVRAMLGTNNENPPVSSGAHGEALVTVNRDSGEITYEARASDVIPRLEQGIRGFDDAAFAIASGAAYVNVHTQVNPGGETRGQLCPTSAAANVINGVALCTLPARGQ